MPYKDLKKRRDCAKKSNKRYWEKNKETINAKARERYHLNKPPPKPKIKKPLQTREEKRAYQREYYAKNREKLLEKTKAWHAKHGKQWREENKERLKEWRKEYQAKNREKINQQSKEWAKKNFDKNPEEVRKTRRLKKKEYKAKDPKRYNEMSRRWNHKSQKKMVTELKDCYVRRLLCKHGVVIDLSAKYIPQDLVEAKRLEIKIRRMVNEKRN